MNVPVQVDEVAAGWAPETAAEGSDQQRSSLQRFLKLVRPFGPIVSLRGLGEAEADLRRRLSRLERHGLVRKATLYDPSRLGQPVSCISLVQLGHHSDQAVAAFERRCRGDASVTAACRVVGRFNYQIASSHADIRTADQWRRDLEAVEVIALVEMRFVRPIKGCGVAGLVILK